MELLKRRLGALFEGMPRDLQATMLSAPHRASLLQGVRTQGPVPGMPVAVTVRLAAFQHPIEKSQTVGTEPLEPATGRPHLGARAWDARRGDGAPRHVTNIKRQVLKRRHESLLAAAGRVCTQGPMPSALSVRLCDQPNAML